ncbi:hypothetical protein HDU93_009003, partial [Gonapodya sp. JEL0774]
IARLSHLAASLALTLSSNEGGPALTDLASWNWDRELTRFWDTVDHAANQRNRGEDATAVAPFASAVVEWMWCRRGDEDPQGSVTQDEESWKEWDAAKIVTLVNHVKKAVKAGGVVSSSAGYAGLGETAPDSKEYFPTESPVQRPRDTAQLAIQSSPHVETPEAAQPSTPQQNEVGQKTALVQELMKTSGSTPAKISAVHAPSVDKHSRTAHPPVHTDALSVISSVSYAEFDTSPILPPAPTEQESAEFAFAGGIGPSVAGVKVMDVKVRNDGSVFAATAPADSHNDRTISILSLTGSPSLIHQIDTGTPRATIALSFHPEHPSWLLSADMDHCVKLWDVETRVCLKVYKKWHTRVIHRIGWVPYADSRAWSCSADQSVRVWDVDTVIADDADGDLDVAKIHANEPFVGVVWSGQGVGQVMVVAMAYAVRVYRARTMGVLRTVGFPDLRAR